MARKKQLQVLDPAWEALQTAGMAGKFKDKDHFNKDAQGVANYLCHKVHQQGGFEWDKSQGTEYDVAIDQFLDIPNGILGDFTPPERQNVRCAVRDLLAWKARNTQSSVHAVHKNDRPERLRQFSADTEQAWLYGIKTQYVAAISARSQGAANFNRQHAVKTGTGEPSVKAEAAADTGSQTHHSAKRDATQSQPQCDDSDEVQHHPASAAPTRPAITMPVYTPENGTLLELPSFTLSDYSMRAVEDALRQSFYLEDEDHLGRTHFLACWDLNSTQTHMLLTDLDVENKLRGLPRTLTTVGGAWIFGPRAAVRTLSQCVQAYRNSQSVHSEFRSQGPRSLSVALHPSRGLSFSPHPSLPAEVMDEQPPPISRSPTASADVHPARDASRTPRGPRGHKSPSVTGEEAQRRDGSADVVGNATGDPSRRLTSPPATRDGHAISADADRRHQNLVRGFVEAAAHHRASVSPALVNPPAGNTHAAPTTPSGITVTTADTTMADAQQHHTSSDTSAFNAPNPAASDRTTPDRIASHCTASDSNDLAPPASELPPASMNTHSAPHASSSTASTQDELCDSALAPRAPSSTALTDDHLVLESTHPGADQSVPSARVLPPAPPEPHTVPSFQPINPAGGDSSTDAVKKQEKQEEQEKQEQQEKQKKQKKQKKRKKRKRQEDDSDDDYAPGQDRSPTPPSDSDPLEVAAQGPVANADAPAERMDIDPAPQVQVSEEEMAALEAYAARNGGGEDKIGDIRQGVTGSLNHDRIDSALMDQVLVTLRVTPGGDRANSLTPDTHFKIPGIKGEGPMLHQIYGTFAIECLHRSDDGKMSTEERQIHGAIVAHTMGMGKTFYNFLQFVINALVIHLWHDFEANPQKHTSDSRCYFHNLACVCNPQSLLHTWDRFAGAYVYLVLPGLLQQTLSQYERFVDVDELEAIIGERPVLVSGHDDTTKSENGRRLGVLAPADHGFQSQYLPRPANWSDVLGKTPLDEPHRYLRRAVGKQLPHPEVPPPKGRPELCFVVSTIYSLKSRVWTYLFRTAFPAVSGLAETAEWRANGEHYASGRVACTGSRCYLGHEKPQQFHQFPTTPGDVKVLAFPIAQVAIDEFHKVAWHPQRSVLRDLCETMRRTFGRGPPIVLLSGTPSAHTPYDAVSLFSCQETEEWAKHPVLQHFTFAKVVPLRSDWQGIEGVVTKNQSGAKVFQSLTGKSRAAAGPVPDEAALIQLFIDTRTKPLQELFQAQVIRHDYSTLMLGQPLQTQPPARHEQRFCTNPPAACAMLAQERSALSSSRALRQAAAEGSAGPDVKRQKVSPSGKSKAKGMRDNAGRKHEGIRVFNMQKDIPYLHTLLQADKEIWKSTILQDRGYYAPGKLSDHPAFQQGRQVLQSSGKLRLLVEVLQEHWGANWRSRLAPSDHGDLVDRQYAENRLPPVLIALDETAMGPLIAAALDAAFPGIRVDGMWPNLSGDHRSSKLDHVQASPENRDTGSATRHCRPTDVFMLPVKTSGEGLNLAMCDLLVHFDVVKNPDDVHQVEGRAARPPKTGPTRIVQLVLEDELGLDALYLRLRQKRAAALQEASSSKRPDQVSTPNKSDDRVEIIDIQETDDSMDDEPFLGAFQ